MGEWVVGENVGDYRLHSGETFPRLSPHMMVCRRGTLSPIVTIMGWSRVGGSVSTTIDCVGGKTSPPAVKRSVVAPFSLWWPDCALHRVHIGHPHIRRPHCTERRMVQHWASYRPNRRYRLGGLDSVFIVESALATWSSTLMCIITIYNAEMDDKAHPRNVLDAMGPSLCSSSSPHWPTHRHHHGCTTTR